MYLVDRMSLKPENNRNTFIMLTASFDTSRAEYAANPDEYSLSSEQEPEMQCINSYLSNRTSFGSHQNTTFSAHFSTLACPLYFN